MKASFQRADLFVLVELRSPVKAGDDVCVGLTMLLPDAKVPKDIPEDFVCGNFTNDGAEVVDGFADVLGG